MRPFHYIIAVLGSAVIFGCGGASREAKTAADEQPEYNWSDYKGTYAPGAPATKDQAETSSPSPKESAETKPPSKTEGASADAKSLYTEEDDPKPAEERAPPKKKKKKKKKGGVAGGSKPSAGSPKKAPRKRAKKT